MITGLCKHAPQYDAVTECYVKPVDPDKAFAAVRKHFRKYLRFEVPSDQPQFFATVTFPFSVQSAGFCGPEIWHEVGQVIPSSLLFYSVGEIAGGVGNDALEKFLLTRSAFSEFIIGQTE